MVQRQIPKPSEIFELMQFKKPKLNAKKRRLDAALTIDDLRRIAKRRTPKAAFDYTDEMCIRDRYRLTRKGSGLFPIFAIVLDLAERWYRDPEGEVLLRRHTACDSRFHGMLVCDQCHEVVRGSTIDVSQI